MVRGGGGGTKCRTCGSIKCNYGWCGGGGVPSVGHVGQSSVIIDGAGGGGGGGGTKCRTCRSIKCNYRWCGGYQVSWVNQV